MKGLIRHEALKVLGKQPFTIDWRTAETLCLWKLHLHRILGWSYLTKLSHIVLRLPEDSSDAPQHEYLKFLNAILVHRPERDLYTGLLCMGNYAELPGLAPKCRCTRAAPVHLCPQCPARRAALRKLSLVVPDESTRMIDVMDPDVVCVSSPWFSVCKLIQGSERISSASFLALHLMCMFVGLSRHWLGYSRSTV